MKPKLLLVGVISLYLLCGSVFGQNPSTFMEEGNEDGLFRRCTDNEQDNDKLRCCHSDFLPDKCACFSIGENSTFSQIPMVTLPSCSSANETTFILKSAPSDEGKILPACSFGKALKKRFKKKKWGKNKQEKVYFIVHGWTNQITKPWIQTFERALHLREPNCHVVIVDWSKAAGQQYAQSLADTRIVGLAIAQMICRMHLELGVPLEDVHIIGHSLGVVVAGVAGAELQHVCEGAKVGRITGMDPASSMLWDAPNAAILDRSDADFVDIIHTDAEDFDLTRLYQALQTDGDIRNVPRGLKKSTGHVDFWPNGGLEQPGCASHTCSHNRVPWLFLSNLLGFCDFSSEGIDGQPCEMGFYADKRACSGDYFNITTSDEFPYCTYD